ncbi:MAG: hypothetical protein JWR62_114 [Modestobacter sp.]|jgi:hypothetical protein|nr:hypothetical protein [Modestobacter sp.]
MSGSPDPDPAAIQAEIERTRDHLGRTIDAIGYRLDVRNKAREPLYRARDTAVETYRESPPVALGAVAVVAAVVGLVIRRRRRRRR